jgi:anti-sigma B factor antagonist
MRETDLSPEEVRVTVLGELDLAVVGRLDAHLSQLTQAGVTVELDLSELEFMDSTGLKTILDASRRAQAGGQGFLVSADVQPQVRRLFELVGLEHILHSTPATP